MSSRVTGVDAARGGWVAVDLDGGAFAGMRFAPSLAALLAGTSPEQVVGVDMPLGLLADGWRAADRLARQRLGPRRNSVFAIPPLPVWRERSYRAARDRCRDLTGAGFSAQAWGLREKLLEADGYRRACGHPLYEVHPELSFAAMAGAVLAESKHAQGGHALRRGLLARGGIVVPDDPGTLPRAVLADVVDAAAAAWTARRIAAGCALALPDPPQRDEDGSEIAIRY